MYFVNREDYEAAKKFDTEEEKTNFYCNVKSAAETGWDFSSRWFVTTNGTNRGLYQSRVTVIGNEN